MKTKQILVSGHTLQKTKTKQKIGSKNYIIRKIRVKNGWGNLFLVIASANDSRCDMTELTFGFPY